MQTEKVLWDNPKDEETEVHNLLDFKYPLPSEGTRTLPKLDDSMIDISHLKTVDTIGLFVERARAKHEMAVTSKNLKGNYK